MQPPKSLNIMKRKCNRSIGKLLNRGKLPSRGIRKRSIWDVKKSYYRAKPKHVILVPNHDNISNLENEGPYQSTLPIKEDYSSSDYLTSEQKGAEQNVLHNNLKMLEEVA